MPRPAKTSLSNWKLMGLRVGNWALQALIPLIGAHAVPLLAIPPSVAQFGRAITGEEIIVQILGCIQWNAALLDTRKEKCVPVLRLSEALHQATSSPPISGL